MHNRRVNKCSLAIAGMVIVLLTTTSTSDSAFAKHLSDVNQAASISNSCLNPISNSNTRDNMISNGNCGGTVSQQQGKSGQASTPTTVQTANPTIEVQRSTTTAQPPLTTTRGNCTACFDPLTAAQKSQFEGIVQHRSSIVFGTNITTIEQLCTFLRNIVLQGRDPIEAIERIQSMLMDVEGVSSSTVTNITSCMQRAIE